MAYTPSPFKPKSTPNNFGGLKSDANRVAMTGALGNYTQSQDASTVPATSPIANGSASGVTLVVPQGAVQCTIYLATAVTALVGEDSTFTAAMFVPTTTYFTVDCANQQNIYIKPSSGTNSIYFQFKMV